MPTNADVSEVPAKVITTHDGKTFMTCSRNIDYSKIITTNSTLPKSLLTKYSSCQDAPLCKHNSMRCSHYGEMYPTQELPPFGKQATMPRQKLKTFMTAMSKPINKFSATSKRWATISRQEIQMQQEQLISNGKTSLWPMETPTCGDAMSTPYGYAQHYTWQPTENALLWQELPSKKSQRIPTLIRSSTKTHKTKVWPPTRRPTISTMAKLCHKRSMDRPIVRDRKPCSTP